VTKAKAKTVTPLLLVRPSLDHIAAVMKEKQKL